MKPRECLAIEPGSAGPRRTSVDWLEDQETIGLAPCLVARRVARLCFRVVVEESCEYALGHPMRPGDRSAIDAKFRALAQGALCPRRTDELLAILRGLATTKKLDELMAALRDVPAASA